MKNPLLKAIYENIIILSKSFPDTESYEENNDTKRNINNVMTVGLWKFFTPWMLGVTRVCMLPWQQ